MSIPTTANDLAATLPEAVDHCSAWLHERFGALTRQYGAHDAIALFSKQTIGDPYSFLVMATEAGVICKSRVTAAMHRANGHIWLGFAHVNGDRSQAQVADLHPFEGWGEHAPLITEMMRTAQVQLDGASGYC